ncbi:MAG: hypothetical protein QOE29_803, partial [Gaiellaceae bacterium]|nr:hypothetical protein [Gaiellaceae bacterium]
MSPRRPLSTLAFLVVAAAAWYFLAPAQLPFGSNAYVETSGTSMLPLYHGGDLVIVRKGSTYQAGDIVAYRNRDLNNLVVLHRIKEIDDQGHYIFKGDNNNFIDPTSLRAPYVTESDLVGKAWVHIPHAGVYMSWIKKPQNAAIIAGIAFLLTFGGLGAARRRSGSEGSGRGEQPARGAGGPSGAPLVRPEHVLAGAAAVTGIFALLALIAFTQPNTKLEVVPDSYTEQVVYNYGAKAKPSAVYPTGKIGTGDTVFSKLARSVHVRVEYTLDGAGQPVASHGTAGLVMRVSGDNLWQRTFVLVAPKPFTAAKFDLDATIRLDKLSGMLSQVEDATGSGSGQTYRINLLATIQQHGRVGTQQLNTTFAPFLPLRYDKIRLYPDSATVNPDGTPAIQYTQSQAGSGTKSAPATIDLKLATLSIGSARTIGAIGALLGALALGGAFLMLRSRRASDEPARIAAGYGEWLVPVTHMTEQAAPFADVASFDALLSLASRADRAIMHYSAGGGHTYFVKEDDVVYRYTAYERAPVPPAAEAEAEQAPDAVLHVLSPEPEAYPAPVLAPLPTLTPVAAAESWSAPDYRAPQLETPPAPVVPVEELPHI